MVNGGNEWAPWCNYLSFVRDVVGFQHESHANYKHYENAAIHSGCRYTHAKFCIVADRPCVRVTRLVGGVHQLHCETGPALAWRDGHERWYIEGFEVDQQIVMEPKSQTVEQINAEKNADIKTIRINRFGWADYCLKSGAKVIESRQCPISGTTEALVETSDGMRRLLVTCPTKRRFAPGVPRSVKTCKEAQEWLAGPLAAGRVVART